MISHVYELPFGAGRRWMSGAGALLQGIVGGWQLVGDHDVDDRAAVHGVAPDRRQQRRAELAESHRSGALDNPTVDLWFNTADFVAPPPNTYGDAGAASSTAPGHMNFDTSLSKRFSWSAGSNLEFRWDVFNLFNHPGFGFPNSAIGNPNAGRITYDDRGQPQHAVRVEIQFLSETTWIRRRGHVRVIGRRGGLEHKLKALFLGIGSEASARARRRSAISWPRRGLTTLFFLSPGTAHEWLTWRRCFKEFAPRLFR